MVSFLLISLSLSSSIPFFNSTTSYFSTSPLNLFLSTFFITSPTILSFSFSISSLSLSLISFSTKSAIYILFDNICLSFISIFFFLLANSSIVSLCIFSTLTSISFWHSLFTSSSNYFFLHSNSLSNIPLTSFWISSSNFAKVDH